MYKILQKYQFQLVQTGYDRIFILCGLDWFFAVHSSFFWSFHNWQPVAVAVPQNQTEKPDQTRPLNTILKRFSFFPK